MIIYNKLVRDKIPEIMANKGEVPHYCVLSKQDYIKELDKKLIEETQEYIKDNTVEELADILEVILAICAEKGYTKEMLEELRKEKALKRGRFSKKYFLISKE